MTQHRQVLCALALLAAGCDRSSTATPTHALELDAAQSFVRVFRSDDSLLFEGFVSGTIMVSIECFEPGCDIVWLDADVETVGEPMTTEGAVISQAVARLSAPVGYEAGSIGTNGRIAVGDLRAHATIVADGMQSEHDARNDVFSLTPSIGPSGFDVGGELQSDDHSVTVVLIGDVRELADGGGDGG